MGPKIITNRDGDKILTMSTQIKFRIRHTGSGKIIGYEMLHPTYVSNNNFEWASSVNGIDWKPGIVLGPGLQREQFTGVLDGRSNEIFVGDIVKYLMGAISKVIFTSSGFQIEDLNHKSSTLFYLDNISQFRAEPTIIGNVWENPELLK